MKGSSYSLRVMKNAKQYTGGKTAAIDTQSKQLNLRQSRSPSLASARSGLSHESLKNKQGPPPHPVSGRPSGKPPTSRGCVKRTKGKGKKGKKGCRDSYDLIVNIDLTEWQLTDEQVAEFKEVFMLFDKDEDGVLTFPELNVVMKSLGQRPSEDELLTMVRDVSEDHIYDTIEFNEFLQMISKQQKYGMTEESLKDAFKIFDKDDDGFITVDELRHIMQSLGEKMKDSDLDEMIAEADSDNDGLINYKEFVQVLCSNVKSKGSKKKKKQPKKATASSNIPTTSITEAIVENDEKWQINKSSTTSRTSSSKLSSAAGFQALPETAFPEVLIPTIKPTTKSVTIKNGNPVTLTKNLKTDKIVVEKSRSKISVELNEKINSFHPNNNHDQYQPHHHPNHTKK